MMKKFFLSALILAALFCFSCTYPYDNPADPGGSVYQGFLSVFTVDEVNAEWPTEGGTLTWCEFLASEVLDNGSDLYGLQVAASVNVFGDTPDITSESNEIDASSMNLNEGTWYYRVAAREAGGAWGPWSDAVSFTADSGVDETGLDPADGGFTPDTTPSLDWPDITGAVSYEVEFATSEAALDGSGAISINSSGYQIPDTDTFAYGDTCYWRVRGVNEDGIAGVWSGVFRVEIQSLIDLVSVTGGTFDMGSNVYSDEQPIHSVTVSDFFISTTEVTQGLYEEVMNDTPASGYGVGDTYPVYYVSWYDAVDFCNALSDLYGLERCYTVNGTDVTCDFTKNGYRLPTEAEWEFAARGGNASNGYTYSGSDNIGDVAWYTDNSSSKSHEVGNKAANELGLYDMSGNLWEWCWDWYYEDYYDVSPESDPTGPSTGSSRVSRGGFWYNNATVCRSANRFGDSPGGSYNGIGFRVARSQ